MGVNPSKPSMPNLLNIQLPESVRAAALEAVSRNEIRRSLKAWCKRVGYTPAFHHEVMIANLELAARGKLKRLLIMMPPGSAKSTYTSKTFVPWYLGQDCLYPDVGANTILACSYSKDLVTGFGRDARNLVKLYGQQLGYTLADDSQAADEWETITSNNHRGRYFCAGTGAGIAGHRATLGLIDDPIADQVHAMSKTERDKLRNWWINDFLPRLLPDAPVVLVCNRRHMEDLAGWLLETEGERWTVLDFPLLARENDVLGRPSIDLALLDRMDNGDLKPGELSAIYETSIKPSLLWNSWFNQSTIETAIKDPRTFCTLWQQRPTPEQGNYFKKEYLQEYTPDMLPKTGLRIYVGSDHAVSTRETANRTCLLPVGVDNDGNIWVLPDIFWKIAGPGECVEAMLDLAARRTPAVWWAESSHITMALKPLIQKRQRERGPYFYIEEVTSSRDKRTRASSMNGRCMARKVFFPSFCHWWPEALHELLHFTGSGADKSDDFVDALSEIGMGLDRMTNGSIRHQSAQTAEADIKAAMEDLCPSKLTFAWMKRSSERAERRANRSMHIGVK
jgi:predicted phage terminase large subunit-like protein